MWCSVDSDEIDESKLEHDETWGWVHNHRGWHTLTGTALIKIDAVLIERPGFDKGVPEVAAARFTPGDDA